MKRVLSLMMDTLKNNSNRFDKAVKALTIKHRSFIVRHRNYWAKQHACQGPIRIEGVQE